MRRIDSHQHFWIYDKERHGWIDDSMRACQQDFLPADLQPILQQNSVEGCVTVQVDQTEAENDFMLGLAQKNTPSANRGSCGGEAFGQPAFRRSVFRARTESQP